MECNSGKGWVGEQGVRDHTIIRTKNGKFVILATDLSLANSFEAKYHGSWGEITTSGSPYLVCWESEDLVHWSEERLIRLGDADFGCVWAPDIIYDAAHDDYVVHWSSSHRSNQYGDKAIYYSRTRDFVTFTAPELLCRKADSGIIDSAIYEEDGRYYRFTKSEANPAAIVLEQGVYEAPTAFRLQDGRWFLMLDFYEVEGAGQGYVPFVADSLASGRFIRSDASFSFPYGFKHGTIMAITAEEYERIRSFYS
ncbi:glycoside hydrolase family 43 protein [Paenibacillus sp. NFR01]|uniref:glycoside hydrolase family 43 protein n=1 Tax=Paenibacillus sp. NFR01 TaxID=1566279 RepID=UPI0008C3B974|nr:glycoside hydrolase family 43 protein [Paenibacillus sp. NFR01]SET08944.1 Glycosyl hydrolases family 43 [Paenibacillus sp. NFR01]